MNFEEKHQLLVSDIEETISILVAHKGKESKHSSKKVVIPDDEFKFNLDGIGSPYIDEVASDNLICNYGDVYSFDSLETEELCRLADHLRKKL